MLASLANDLDARGVVFAELDRRPNDVQVHPSSRDVGIHGHEIGIAVLI